MSLNASHSSKLIITQQYQRDDLPKHAKERLLENIDVKFENGRGTVRKFGIARSQRIYQLFTCKDAARLVLDD